MINRIQNEQVNRNILPSHFSTSRDAGVDTRKPISSLSDNFRSLAIGGTKSGARQLRLIVGSLSSRRIVLLEFHVAGKNI
jgi:hypothetical protein